MINFVRYLYNLLFKKIKLVRAGAKDRCSVHKLNFRCRYKHVLPYDFHHPIRDNEHLSGYLPAAADQIPGGKNICSHFQHQVVKELRTTLLKNCHLEKYFKTVLPEAEDRGL